MTNFDMSGVGPLRLTEIKRRVATIENFLRIARPTQSDRDDHARQIGLSTKSFMRLVTIWKRRRIPADLDGAGVPERKPRRNRMPEATRTAIADAARELGSNATIAAITERAGHMALERGTAVVGRSAVWNVLMEMRREGRMADADLAIVLTQATLRIAVVEGDGVILPRLSFAMLAPEGGIVAHRLLMGPRQETDNDWLAASAERISTSGAERRRLLAASRKDGERSLAGQNVDRLVSKTLGRGIEHIGIAYRVSESTIGGVVPRAKLNQPLTFDDAVKCVDLAIAAHNARRCPNGLPSYDIERAGSTARS